MPASRLFLIPALLSLAMLSVTGLPGAPQRPRSKDAPGKGDKTADGPTDPAIVRLRQRLVRLRLEHQELQLSNNVAEEKLKARLAVLRSEAQLLQAQNAKDMELIRQKNAGFEKEKNRIALEMQRIGLRNTKLNLEKAELQARLSALQTRIAKRKSQDSWRAMVERPPVYARQPFVRGRLTISDRRVELNGPIYYDMANLIAKQIAFYNNKSEVFPIFIVIDASPGGSVMAGYGIIQAMRASRAPVYVVVKSYAASMAAVIAAVAPRSYALPNAVLLHHQVSSMARGNLTQQKERLRLASEWMRRLAAPVAAKMGLNLKQFVAMMYRKNSDGNWQEFGDQAVRLKWVDSIVTEIDEQGVRDSPPAPTARPVLRFEKTDEHGNRYIQLPRLEPFDMHFLYNPEGYYRP